MISIKVLSMFLFVIFFFKLLEEIRAFQLFGYYRKPYINWELRKRFYPEDTLLYIALFTVLVAYHIEYLDKFLLAFGLKIASFITVLIFISFKALIFKAVKPKKKLVYTGRIKRQIATSVIIYFLALLPVYLLDNPLYFILTYILVYVFNDVIVVAADIINRPIENMINERYVSEARKLLEQAPFLRTIAITGSYGKTSTKNIISSVISPNFNTLMSPESYNTKLGLTRIIRSDLVPTTEIFIAEMGSKSYGELADIGELVKPNLAVVTSIGTMHLETFGSFENIIKEKNSLFDSLSEGGVAFINESDENIKNHKFRPDIKKITYSLDSSSDYYATDIRIENGNTTFTFVDSINSTSTTFTTKLLGKHNILNIVVAVAVASYLGISTDDLKFNIAHLSPVKNRLSIRTDKDITFIEDAFNSNPVGARAALEVLRDYNGNRKIVITPGMIELGDMEQEIHETFGRQINAVADIAILVGENQTKYIKQGILKANTSPDEFIENSKTFTEGENLFIVNTMFEAFDKIREIRQEGDVILIENDLPDTFEETL